MSPLAQLLEGYDRFRRDGWEVQRRRWTALAEGQSPRVLVIACSDSRVDPATVFDTSPGEIFVVRNVAALVPPFESDGSHHGTSAAIEFAVTQLKVAEIVVMGHEFCGGCKASLTRAFADAEPGAGGFVANWVALLDEGRDRVTAAHASGEAAERAMEQEAVAVSLANLRTFPFVVEAEAAGRLRLQGAWFAIRDGVLRLLDEASGRFEPA
ncbi:carbonic anhydrase [Sphingomonas sp.]|uniref:carbonic anhydrase n=1 Tax=Sphingomonas sp. TaxID=28214 RepID=UPI003B00CDE8